MKSYWYFLFVAIVIIAWVLYPISLAAIYSTKEAVLAPFVMVFGSFIAGVSSEGGGAVAFPVFTLVFELKPEIARNFSLAIQSIGMTAATLLLVDYRTKFYAPAIIYGSIGGIIGFILGSFISSNGINMALLKLVFVSLWLSFGITLYRIHRAKGKVVIQEKNEKDILINPSVKIQLIIYSIIGGIITAFFGNGIDIVLFSILVLKFNLDTKVATVTSIVLMTIITIFGFGMHFFVIQDFGEIEFNLWLACIPVVIFGAPLGSFILKKSNSTFILIFLIVIILTQYIGAIFVLRPSIELIGYSCLTIIIGLLLFNWIRLPITRKFKP